MSVSVSKSFIEELIGIAETDNIPEHKACEIIAEKLKSVLDMDKQEYEERKRRWDNWER